MDGCDVETQQHLRHDGSVRLFRAVLLGASLTTHRAGWCRWLADDHVAGESGEEAVAGQGEKEPDLEDGKEAGPRDC